MPGHYQHPSDIILLLLLSWVHGLMFFEKTYIYFSFVRFYPKFQQVKNIEACQIIFLILYFVVAKSG
jgi:hypothetical protein